jgi:IS605 OrfB family transposase
LSKVTIQTSILKNEDNVAALSFLEEYGVIFGSAIRTGFSIRNKLGADTNKTKRQLESEISKQLEFKYGLSSTDARNAYSKAEATYASFLELVNLYIDERYESIKAANKSIKKLEKQLVKAQKQNNQLKIKHIKKKLHYKSNKIQSLQAKIVKHQEQRDSGRFSVTFGSSRLFDKHHRLEINGYKNHQEWLEDWRRVRSNRIYYEGAKLFLAGNQLCKFNPTSETLTLTVPPCLVDKYGKTVTLYGINFNYGQDWLSDALTPTKYPDGKPHADKQKYRTGTLKPVTYELVNRAGRWYINATIDSTIGTIITSTEKGILGIDFNPSSIDWAIVERHGNLKRHGSIKINIQDKSSNQTEDILGKAIASIVRIAQKYQVPIAIEDLDFRQKKAALKERSTKYARMLSNFAYSKFIQLIETRCCRQGVELNRVDPAYTSVIGITKYMALYGLNSGCAAALVIARRGQGRTEKLPISHARYFKRPEDRLKSGAWGKVSKKINICGGIARNKFYFLGDKKVRTNRSLHGKLRQIQFTKWAGQTVQVLRTPNIKLKT